jgi:hypothetical protein
VSQAASQATAFYHDVARNHKMWTIRDEQGYPAPKASDGTRSQPFWSSLSRAQRIVETVAAYKGMWPVEISWAEFCDTLLPELERDGMKVGLNWSGPMAVGYDREAIGVRRSVEAYAALAAEHGQA